LVHNIEILNFLSKWIKISFITLQIINPRKRHFTW
jgi:hypothetical protein